MARILIIDDDADICLLLKKFFQKKGFEADTASNGEEGINKVKSDLPDVVLCDFKLPDYTGLEVLQKIKIINRETQVIIITGYSDVGTAVDTLKKGAFDYVTKPLYPDEILLTVNRALASEATPEKPEGTPKPKKQSTERVYINGDSRQSQTVQKHIDLIAPTDMSVIILGETGTGKEYVARAIHEKSNRASQPFVAVDCGALPKDLAGSELFGHVKGAFTGALSDKVGCFQQANGGTLFLDEIGNLNYEHQVQLLRVLQEGMVRRIGDTKEIAVDVRVLVATNEDLKKSSQSGEFREDIYHRLNEFMIQLSPLRERREDIMAFANHFLEVSNEELGKNVKGFDPAAEKVLINYYWHGNIRELKNVIKRAVLLCQSSQIDQTCLPVEIVSQEFNNAMTLSNGSHPKTLKDYVSIAEKKAILETLQLTNNNKSKTAELLDVDRKTLYNKIKVYNIDL